MHEILRFAQDDNPNLYREFLGHHTSRLLKKYFLGGNLTAAAKSGAENKPAIAALKRLCENLFLSGLVERNVIRTSPGGAADNSPPLQRWEKWEK